MVALPSPVIGGTVANPSRSASVAKIKTESAPSQPKNLPSSGSFEDFEVKYSTPIHRSTAGSSTSPPPAANQDASAKKLNTGKSRRMYADPKTYANGRT